MMKMQVHGLQDLDRALAELPKATARNTLRRALRKAAEPIADAARARLPSPGRTGEGHLARRGIIVTERLPAGDAGKQAFAAALRGGASRSQAGAALRAARGNDPTAFARIFVGPGRDPAAMMQEFGTVRHGPQPYMRPAFDTEAQTAIGLIHRELKVEIEKSAARLARKAARMAAKNAG